MNFYFIGNGQGKNSLLTKHHFILLKLTRKVVFQGGCGVTFSNFYRGETIYCLQMHDIFWTHRIIGEKKILLYS